MADTTTNIADNSAELIAYKLFQEVARAEGKELWAGAAGTERPDRRWLLDTYAECISAVKFPARRKSPTGLVD